MGRPWTISTPNNEIRGLRLEIFGLALVLFAFIWQGTISEIQDNRTKAMIEQVKGELEDWDRSERSIYQCDKTPDKQNQIVDATKATPSPGTWSDPQQRDIIEAQQAHARLLGYIRLFIAVVGSTLIIAGKYFVATHKAEAAIKVKADQG